LKVGAAPLSSAERRRLRGLAHGLEPLVRVGRGGMSDAVLRAIESALDAHELVKVRFLGGKDELRASGALVERSLGATIVGAIGHVAILYRQHPDSERRRIEL
jgi:RNA-binding protein